MILEGKASELLGEYQISIINDYYIVNPLTEKSINDLELIFYVTKDIYNNLFFKLSKNISKELYDSQILFIDNLRRIIDYKFYMININSLNEQILLINDFLDNETIIEVSDMEDLPVEIESTLRTILEIFENIKENLEEFRAEEEIYKRKCKGCE